MKQLTSQMLIEACDDTAFEAGITIRSRLEPIAGPGAPVKPAVYEGGRYQEDRRWRAIADGAKPEAVTVIVIDNVPSQANRLEAALEKLCGTLGLPSLVLDLAGLALPAHLPRQLTAFQFPHRNADAYLRDAVLDGDDFMKSHVGKSIFEGSAENPGPLFAWMPQALLYGFWQSHLGKKRQQTKLPRSWVSEIVGIHPAVADRATGTVTMTRTLGMKGDPLNLSIDEAAEFEDNDHTTWALTGAAKSGTKGDTKRKKERLSELGHGQVLSDGTPAGVSFAEIEQQATVSFAGLRRISCSAEGRALLVALGLVAHVGAFGRSFSLRSGCDLRSSSLSWTWLGATEDEPLEPLSMAAATDLFASCVAAADGAGLPVGSKWQRDALRLKPQPKLGDVIRKTWPAFSDEATEQVN